MIKLNSTVICPTDRGNKAYKGKATQIGTTVYKNIKGTEYVWVTVRDTCGISSVWPSNRLN